MNALIKAVRAHAESNYNVDGWDVVVECYEDSEIAEVIQGASTEAQAISMMKKIVSAYDDRRKDIQAEAF